MKDASRSIGIGDEDDDGKISRRGNFRWIIACGFGTELCCQADTSKVGHEEYREIAVSRDQAQRFSDPPA
jgi:hypothetical protein